MSPHRIHAVSQKAAGSGKDLIFLSEKQAHEKRTAGGACINRN
jgi:hypothetical protein